MSIPCDIIYLLVFHGDQGESVSIPCDIIYLLVFHGDQAESP